MHVNIRVAVSIAHQGTTEFLVANVSDLILGTPSGNLQESYGTARLANNCSYPPPRRCKVQYNTVLNRCSSQSIPSILDIGFMRSKIGIESKRCVA